MDRHRLRRVQHDEVGMQIAPMIDITLLLLFFFMLSGKLTRILTSGYSHSDGRVRKIPEETGDRDIINIDEKGQLFTGHQPVTAKQLTVHLKERFELSAAQTLYSGRCPDARQADQRGNAHRRRQAPLRYFWRAAAMRRTENLRLAADRADD
jgi:biopolymer transport protein ExbD